MQVAQNLYWCYSHSCFIHKHNSMPLTIVDFQ